MTYFPADMPLPNPDAWETGFWEHCRNRTLKFQACANCGTVRHPPLPMCAKCRSVAVTWVEATNDAELYTYTIVHHANFSALDSVVPYNAAVVIFPSLQGVRLVTNIVDCPLSELRIGMKLDLVWEKPKPGIFLPRFRPQVRR